MHGRPLVIISSILFMVACCLPITGSSDPGGAFLYALFGWAGIFMSSFGWFANIAAALSAWWLLLGERKASRISAVIAMILVMDAFFLTYDYSQINHMSPLPLIKFSDWGLGFYCWATSILVITVAAFTTSVPQQFPPRPTSEERQ
ncbi:MAG TPA: hypothetical protein V6D22_11625 [Candidatus Obscuribacterales bacterium]